jgi:hypothetical protein
MVPRKLIFTHTLIAGLGFFSYASSAPVSPSNASDSGPTNDNPLKIPVADGVSRFGNFILARSSQQPIPPLSTVERRDECATEPETPNLGSSFDIVRRAPIHLRATPDYVHPIVIPPHGLHRRVVGDLGVEHPVHVPGQQLTSKSAFRLPSTGAQGEPVKKKKLSGFKDEVDVGRYAHLHEWKEGDDERDEAARAAGVPPFSPVETDKDRAKADKERQKNIAWAKLSTVEKATATHRPPGRSGDSKWDIPPTSYDPEDQEEENEQIVSPGGDEIRHGPTDWKLREKMHASQSKNTVLRTEGNKHAVKPKLNEGEGDSGHQELLAAPSTVLLTKKRKADSENSDMTQQVEAPLIKMPKPPGRGPKIKLPALQTGMSVLRRRADSTKRWLLSRA